MAWPQASETDNDLFGHTERERRAGAMRNAVRVVSDALQKLGRPSPWSGEIKATDDLLDPLFKEFSKKFDVPLTLCKSAYHKLATFIDSRTIDPEVGEKLDILLRVVERAKPFQSV